MSSDRDKERSEKDKKKVRIGGLQDSLIISPRYKILSQHPQKKIKLPGVDFANLPNCRTWTASKKTSLSWWTDLPSPR